jgi:glycosyltransferase involved in cell wall biosynthesis
MQIVKPDEIVFSDNYSTDQSLDIVKMFPDLNIRVIQPASFLTMSENWNFVANQTKSDWFFLLSNDDLLRNTAVKRLKEIAVRLPPSIGVVSFKSEIINENSKVILGKFRFGKPKLRVDYEFLKQNVRFLQINAASVAIKRVSWIDVGRFPIEYSVLHDLVFYQRVILKWGILESKEVLGRYRIYTNKPNSEARSKLVLKDFQTYENSDLKCYIEKYPDLLESYISEGAQNSSSILRGSLLMRLLRSVVLSVITLCRRSQSTMKNSGFPNRSSLI